MPAKGRRNWWKIKLPNSNEGGSSRRNRMKADENQLLSHRAKKTSAAKIILGWTTGASGV